MLDVLSKISLSEPSTRYSEELSHLENYPVGRPIDFKNRSGFSFSSSNTFTLDNTAFSPVYAVNRYGAQDNFTYPSLGILRSRMFWDSSSHPVPVGPVSTDGFKIFGNYIGVMSNSGSGVTVKFSLVSSTSFFGYISSYDSLTGEAIFKFDDTKNVFSELDSSGLPKYSVMDNSGFTYGYNGTSYSSVLMPDGTSYQSTEKYTEGSCTCSSYDSSIKEIGLILPLGLSDSVVQTISVVSPNNCKVRFIDLGRYTIGTDSEKTATSVSNVSSTSSMSISSYIYYSLPYSNPSSYIGTKTFICRTPSFDIPIESLRVLVVYLEKLDTVKTRPFGYSLRAR